MSAINAGGLFSVNIDVIHSQIGQAAHAESTAKRKETFMLFARRVAHRVAGLDRWIALGSPQPVHPLGRRTQKMVALIA